jgi:hypothetical protein
MLRVYVDGALSHGMPISGTCLLVSFLSTRLDIGLDDNWFHSRERARINTRIHDIHHIRQDSRL